MAERPDIEQTLLAEIRRRTVQMSEAQHAMARQQRILVHAATQLRMGRSAAPVLAEIREQSPELLRDWCDIHLTITAGPVRPVPRVAASA